MADIITTIGSGQTYATIEDWWASVGDTGDRHIGEFQDAVTVSVSTLAAKANSGGAELRAAESVAYNFANPSAPHAKITASSGYAIYNRTTSKFIVSGFEIESTAATPSALDNPIGVDISADQDMEFYKCRIKGGESIHKGRSSAGASAYFENCHMSDSTKLGLWAPSSGTVNTKHCVVENCNTSLTSGHGGIKERAGNTNDSTVCINNGVADFQGAVATDINCASGDSTARGTQPVIGVTTADFDDTLNDIWTSKTGGLLDSAGTSGTDIGLSLVIVDQVLILSPSENELLNRDKVTGTRDILISGTYSGPTAPTAIEASFNGGAYETIDSAPSGGVFSGTLLSQPVGNGTLNVRFANSITVTSGQLNVAVGVKFLVWGQSNFSGRATNAQAYTSTSGFFHKYTVLNNIWELGADPFDSSTLNGSVFPLIANHIVNGKATPVAFVGVAQGGTPLADWQNGQALNTRMLDYISNSGGNDIEGVISWIGENDATLGTDESTFKTQYNSVINQLETQTGAKSLLCGVASSSGVSVNTWIQDVVASNPNAIDYVDIAALFTGTHYETDQETSDSALAIYNKIDTSFFSSTESAINIAATNTPNGTYPTLIFNPTDYSVIHSGNVAFTSGAATIPTIPLAVGSAWRGVVFDNNATPTDGAAIVGVTE